MSYLFSFSGYQTKCVIEFLLRQLMTSWTLRFTFDHPQSNGRQVEKEGRTEIQKIEYLENEKSFLDEIKSNFHGFWRAIIWWINKNLMKIADTSFNLDINYMAAFDSIKLLRLKKYLLCTLSRSRLVPNSQPLFATVFWGETNRSSFS